MSHAIHIDNRRELFWDEFLIDAGRTTAKLTLHRPQPKEVVIDHDEAWEGDGCDYHSIVADDGLYRMYYLGWDTSPLSETGPTSPTIVVCYVESTDGKSWIKPNLGICEFAGSKDNNIILDQTSGAWPTFSVFKDTNPTCPKEELYKGIGLNREDRSLRCFTSSDGIHFRDGWLMTKEGWFDTLNVALWDRHTEQYFCYIRAFHDAPPGRKPTEGIRDIRWMVSRDFKEWSTPVLLDFGEADDYPLYTNVVQQYYRSDSMFIGFPSRYVEKEEWTSNFDQMGGVERRRARMKAHPRYGLTITDCVFMSSRDGKRWNRWDEAFMTPGLEHQYNWVYGDCYPALGLIETDSDLPGSPTELSLYAFENHWGKIPTQLRRYTIRPDGFVSYRATYKPCTVVTKPFVFAGDILSINFATSAAGYVKIRLTGKDAAIESIELFGNSLERRVEFKGATPSSLAGQPVEMEITMSDADIYSFKFT